MKYWETIADNLSKAGWSWGCVSALDLAARTIWITDAHRDGGKRYVVRADDMRALHFWNYRPRFIVDLSSDGKSCVSSMFC